MDENEIITPGMVQKAASLSAGEITDAQLAKINKYAMEPLTAEKVFVFKAVLCDNDIDRTYEQFTEKSLDNLRKLFVGKTVIKDHRRAADSQIARIFDTELVRSDTKQVGDQPYTQLVAHCYMVKTASNADLIEEIKGGIRKEGSVGCSVGKVVCSICGADNRKAYCQHWHGKKYDGKTCHFLLDDANDAYEFSLVAVPAQKAAGITKSYTGKLMAEPEEIKDQPQETPADDTTKTMLLRARLMALRARAKEE